MRRNPCLRQSVADDREACRDRPRPPIETQGRAEQDGGRHHGRAEGDSGRSIRRRARPPSAPGRLPGPARWRARPARCERLATPRGRVPGPPRRRPSRADSPARSRSPGRGRGTGGRRCATPYGGRAPAKRRARPPASLRRPANPVAANPSTLPAAPTNQNDASERSGGGRRGAAGAAYSPMDRHSNAPPERCGLQSTAAGARASTPGDMGTARPAGQRSDAFPEGRRPSPSDGRRLRGGQSLGLG